MVSSPTPKTIITKSDMAKYIAEATDSTQAATLRMLDALGEYVTKALTAGNDLRWANMGTFAVGETAARTGRNPLTGASITIKASRRVRFRPSKALKDAVAAGRPGKK